MGILASPVNENHIAFAGSTEIGPLIRKIAILNVSSCLLRRDHHHIVTPRVKCGLSRNPVIKIATSYNVLVVTPSLAAKSVSELVNTPPITMRYGLTFHSGRMRPACARSSGSETFRLSDPSAGYTIDMHES